MGARACSMARQVVMRSGSDVYLIKENQTPIYRISCSSDHCFCKLSCNFDRLYKYLVKK
jgi:hypothetical protein